MAAALALCRRSGAGALSLPLLCARSVRVSKPSARCLTTAPPPLVTRNVGGFELCSLQTPCSPQPPRPLLVLIGWLNAKRRNLRKYQELYCERGLDVLTVPVSPLHIVRPRYGIAYTAKLLRVLQEHEDLSSRQVVLHGFSVGAFIFTQLQLMLEEQGKRGRDLDLDLGPRLAGLVMDSPTYMDQMCQGISRSVTTIPAAQALVKRSLLLYLAAFPRSVAYHFQESQRVFNRNRLPTLLLYSPHDLISCAPTSERYAAEWRAHGVQVFTRPFSCSAHVEHFRRHPEEYRHAVDGFLDRLELFGPSLVPLAAQAAQAQ